MVYDLIGLSSSERLIEVGLVEILLRDCNEEPEGVLRPDEQQARGGDKVHSLTVPRHRVVQAVGTQHGLQMMNLKKKQCLTRRANVPPCCSRY